MLPYYCCALSWVVIGLEHSNHKTPNEQWIIYAEKTVNNFSSNAEQKIILCRMLEIAYAENSEQFLWENSE